MATLEELSALAQAIANEHLEDAEYSIVYEDECAEHLTDEEMRVVYTMITSSRAVLPEGIAR
jgi:hypothetical protein